MTTTTRISDHTHTDKRLTLTGFMTTACNCNQLEQEQDNNYECYGYCWDEQLEDWTNCMQEWVDENPTDEWLVTDFPTWTGGVTGVTVARTAEELLRAITPQSEYNMRWTLSTTTDPTTQATTRMLECVLSHHDAPTGGRMTVQHAPMCDD
ncbi:hypothetical protein UFOVP361_128 [uncultured Caudovirales phage]|uniref:Uncharacterized protein n=1 Tax=uncultured Caudovirales phage TaxID=2100421 RepID=A0A6J7WZN6_9CAUD|nr:hypothetical protein UFOVP361_128 [uncultured Caudovirales phage]